MTGADDNTQPATCEVTIRFPQTDAAGIVFYPRYFEMVQRCFPGMPFEKLFTVKTEFLRPNRLGDVLTLSYDRRGPRDWSVHGRIDEDLYFSMTSDPEQATAPADAHLSAAQAFRTTEEPIGSWALGWDRRLQLSRYFELLNMAIEEWFEDTLDVPFHELHVGRKIGIPTVQFDTLARSLPPEGAKTAIWIRPDKVGERALTFTSWLVANDVCFVQNQQVVVFVEMQEQGYQSTRIPEYIADAFSAQIEAEGTR